MRTLPPIRFPSPLQPSHVYLNFPPLLFTIPNCYFPFFFQSSYFLFSLSVCGLALERASERAVCNDVQHVPAGAVELCRLAAFCRAPHPYRGREYYSKPHNDLFG
ncbi:hypothetical protein E2C01_085303 [Portunus trituberculatus]|uniref:Uncharacterized protein n=1 Tax=Portunus trituberculatus TaxID=210409 RepID=A0A5B7J8I4_PORTR|nr:hypothetical protein [Portunus trituberculatus]